MGVCPISFLLSHRRPFTIESPTGKNSTHSKEPSELSMLGFQLEFMKWVLCCIGKFGAFVNGCFPAEMRPSNHNQRPVRCQLSELESEHCTSSVLWPTPHPSNGPAPGITVASFSGSGQGRARGICEPKEHWTCASYVAAPLPVDIHSPWACPALEIVLNIWL